MTDSSATADNWPPQPVEWDAPTIAEQLADAWHREQSRGRHGIREWPKSERHRQIATERAEAVIAQLKARGIDVVAQNERTIRAIEDLNALPVRAIVRDANGFVFEYAPTGEGDNTWWYDGGPHDPDEVDLPALVIWCPADEAEVQQ